MVSDVVSTQGTDMTPNLSSPGEVRVRSLGCAERHKLGGFHSGVRTLVNANECQGLPLLPRHPDRPLSRILPASVGRRRGRIRGSPFASRRLKGLPILNRPPGISTKPPVAG